VYDSDLNLILANNQDTYLVAPGKIISISTLTFAPKVVAVLSGGDRMWVQSIAYDSVNKILYTVEFYVGSPAAWRISSVSIRTGTVLSFPSPPEEIVQALYIDPLSSNLMALVTPRTSSNPLVAKIQLPAVSGQNATVTRLNPPDTKLAISTPGDIFFSNDKSLGYFFAFEDCGGTYSCRSLHQFDVKSGQFLSVIDWSSALWQYDGVYVYLPDLA